MEAIFQGCKLGWSLRETHLWLLVKTFRGEQRAPCLSVPLPAVRRGGRSGFLMPPTSMITPCVETASSPLSWASTCFSTLSSHRRGELLVYTIEKCKDLHPSLPDGYLAFTLQHFDNAADRLRLLCGAKATRFASTSFSWGQAASENAALRPVKDAFNA